MKIKIHRKINVKPYDAAVFLKSEKMVDDFLQAVYDDPECTPEFVNRCENTARRARARLAAGRENSLWYKVTHLPSLILPRQAIA